MKTYKLINAPRGFSMIEVLISVVVLGFGLLALAALQTTIIRSSSETKAQTIALQLAKDKIEDLRSYENLTGYQALTKGSDSVGNLSGVDFTRTWLVARCVYQIAGGTQCWSSDATNPWGYTANLTNITGITPTGGSPALYIANNEFKRVAVVVKWSDANGVEQSIGLEDALGAISPGDGSKVVLNNTSTSVPRYPRVLINNPSNTAGVIPIAVGGGSETAATNPKPEIAGNNNNQRVVETRFDVLTYAGLNNNSNLAQAQSRVETAIVGCTCNKANAVSTDTAYRPTYWNGFRYTVPTVASYTPKSAAATLANNAPPQSQYCNTCCRDHHDDSVSNDKPHFDPRRTKPPLSSSHIHYKLVNGSLVAAGANDDYLESCRLIRVDGIFRVAADMYDEYFNLLETKNDGSTTAYAPTATAIDNYQDIVLDYLNLRVVDQSNVAKYNELLNSTQVALLEATRTINNPTSISIQRSNDFKWLHSRGLFIDYLESEAIDKIVKAKIDCPSIVPTKTTAECVLKYMPFTSINMTELSNWSPTSGIQLVVSNNDFSGAGSGDPVRGKVVPGSNPTNNTTQVASTTMYQSNSGLAVLGTAIDADETSVLDNQDFAIGGAPPPNEAGAFSVNLTGYSFGLGSSNPTVRTTYASLDCNPTLVTVNPYACTVSQIDVSSTLTIGKYNYEGAKVAYSATAGSSGVSCTKGNTTITNIGLSILANSSNARRICKNFSVASTSVGSIGTVTNNGKGSETTAITGTFANASVINIGLTAESDTNSTIVECKYTGNYDNGDTIPDNSVTLTWSDPCL